MVDCSNLRAFVIQTLKKDLRIFYRELNEV